MPKLKSWSASVKRNRIPANDPTPLNRPPENTSIPHRHPGTESLRPVKQGRIGPGLKAHLLQGLLGGLLQAGLFWITVHIILLFAGAPLAVVIGSSKLTFLEYLIRIILLALLCFIAGTRLPRFATTRGTLSFFFLLAVDWANYQSLPYKTLLTYNMENLSTLLPLILAGLLTCLGSGWFGARLTLKDMGGWWRDEIEEFRRSIGLTPR